MEMMKTVRTFGELKEAGYTQKTIKEEIRHNLIDALRNDKEVFSGIQGYDDTVIPDLQRALLAQHNILLLGLRGQAKTRIARLMTELLDDYIPIIKGSQVNDCPFGPVSKYGKKMIEEHGDDTPIEWLSRDDRFVEKLATPDVSVSDLIGDLDPIKAATLKLSFDDEEVIHYGLLPRANRSIFVINELSDLQARIQVSLFNILQEGDIQIRGFKVRMPLDVQFIFTANPEDYTNRGSIVTPLKDRIESQILTHYPNNIEIARSISRQEAVIKGDQKNIVIPEILENVLEHITFSARSSEFIDVKSGVSARLSIAARECLLASVERRMLLNNESEGRARVSDLWSVIPAITGKVELVYEGEQMGSKMVALHLMGEAIKKEFEYHFDVDLNLEEGDKSDYQDVIDYFSSGAVVEVGIDEKESDFVEKMNKLSFVDLHLLDVLKEEKDVHFLRDFFLHGMGEFDFIEKALMPEGYVFSDYMGDLLDDLNFN